MAQVKNTSQESVEKKFKDVFERSPGAFPEGTSLEEKVNYIAKRTEALKTIKNKELENKMKSVAELNQKLESQKRHVAKEARQNLERLDRQLKEDGYTFTNKGLKKLRDNKEFQEVANTPRKTTAEGKGFEHNKQKKTSEISVQTDTQPPVNVEAQTPSKPKSQAFSFPASKDSTKEKSNNKKPEKAKVPLKQSVSPSVNESSTEKKSSDKKPQSDKKENAVQSQENKKEEGLFSLLKRFVKKILEKLLGEDEKSVKNAHDTKGAVQKSTSSNDRQQQSIGQASSININGREFNLEPGKAFNYQDKALNINITYNSPETKQNLQQGTTSPDIVNAMNLNINGREYNVQPGKSFNYKSPSLEISVVNGHQQIRDFDKVLSQDQSISKGLSK